MTLSLLGVSVSQCTEEAWLLSPDDPVRKWLCNLCHEFNHLTLRRRRPEPGLRHDRPPACGAAPRPSASRASVGVLSLSLGLC